MSISSLRLATVFTALTAAGLCVPASAQSSTSEKPRWNVGISAVLSPSPYRNYDNKAWPLPVVNYEGRSFYFRGASIGYRLLNSRADEFSVLVSPMGNRFRHDDSRDPQLRRLSDRDVSGMAGLAWRHRAAWGIVQARVQKEFTGHGSGSMLDLNYSYPIVKGHLSLVPVLGTSYSNSALNDYYYGISAREAFRSGLPAYHAGGGSSPYFGIIASYKLSRTWLAAGGARYTRLPHAVTDSPMVDADHTVSYFASLSYVF